MAKQQDPLRSIYNDLGLEQAGIAYDKFSTKFMADSNARRSVYNDLGLEQAGVDYDLFEERVGVKKKGLSQSDSQSGLETSGQPSAPSPEFEASNAAYAAEADNRLAAQDQRRQEALASSNDSYARLADDRAASGYAPYETEDGWSDGINRPNIAGTFREGLSGDWFYTADNYETYVPTPDVIQNVGGYDNLREFFRKNHPDVLLTNPETGQVEDFGAKPVDIELSNAIDQKISELQSKPFEEWDEDDRLGWFVSNMEQLNAGKTRWTEDQKKAARVQQRGERDAARDENTGFVYQTLDKVSDLIDGVGSGGASFLAGMLGTPEFLWDLVQSTGFRSPNMHAMGTWRQTFGEDELLSKGRDYLMGAVDREALYRSVRDNNKGIWESFKEGDIDAGIRMTANAIGQSVPYMASMMFGGSGVMNAYLSTASGRYHEEQMNNPEKDLGAMMLNSNLWALAEIVPERIGMGAMLEPYKRLAKQAGFEVASNALAKSFRRFMGKANVVTPHGIEMSTELSTTFLQNAIDGNPLTQGWEDTIIVSGAMSTVITSPGQIANAVYDNKVLNEVNKLSRSNAELEVTLADPELAPEVREAATEHYLENVEKINSYIEEQLDKKGRLSSAQKELVDDLEARKQRMSVLLDSDRVPDAVKEEVQADIDAINDEITDIVEQSAETQVEADASVTQSEGPVATESTQEAEALAQEKDAVTEPSNVDKNDAKRIDEILADKASVNKILDTPVTEFDSITIEEAQQAYDEATAALQQVQESNISRPRKREFTTLLNNLRNEIKSNETKFKTTSTTRETTKTTTVGGIRAVEQQTGTETEQSTPKTINEAIGQEVFYNGVRGVLSRADDNSVVFEGFDGKSIEVPNATKTGRQNLSSVGITPYVAPQLGADNSLSRGGEPQGTLVSVNKDNNGNVVSYTMNTLDGQTRTIRDDVEALDIAIQQQHNTLGGIEQIPMERFEETFQETITEVVNEPGVITPSETSGTPDAVTAQDQKESPAETPAGTSTESFSVVEESQSQPGQYFTRDIGGEQTVYRRNEDGTSAIIPDAEAQNILSQQERQAVPSDRGTSVSSDQTAAPTEIAVAYAPLREHNVTNAQEDKSVRDSPAYKAFESFVKKAAKALGIPVNSRRNTWGGYVDGETGRPVQEVSNVMTITGTPEQARLLAAVIGQNAPETQDSVLVGDYSPAGQGSEYVISVGSFENAQKSIPLLKENGIEYFTLDKDTGDIIILDLDGGLSNNIDGLIEKLKENGTLENIERAATNAEFIGQNDYGRIIEEARNKDSSKNWSDLDAAIEGAKRSYAETNQEVTSPQEVNEALPQQETIQEDKPAPVQPEAVQEAEDTTNDEGAPEPAVETAKPKKAPTIKDILKSPDARQNRLQELRDRMAKYRSESRDPNTLRFAAVDPKKQAEYWRDVTDYAAIRLIDGAISTARQLARELGITESPKLNKAFSDAKKLIADDDDLMMTTARNADTARKRAELGFDERIPVVRVSNEEINSRAREQLESGKYDVSGLIDRVMNGEAIDNVETAILAQYTAAQEAAIIEKSSEIENIGSVTTAENLQKLVRQRNDLLDNALQAYNALEMSGTVAARALGIRKLLVNRDLSLAKMIADMRTAKGNVTLNAVDTKNLEAKYVEMQKLAEAIRERNEVLERENAQLNALLATERMQSELKAARDKLKARKPRKEAVADTRERIKEVLLPEFKEALKDVFSGVVGFAHDAEGEARKDIRLAKATYELVKGYIQEYLALGRKYSVDDIVDRLHQEVSTVAPNVTRDQVFNLLDSSNPERRQTKTDLSNALQLFRTEVRLMNEINRLEKGGDLREKLRRTPTEKNVRLDELRKRLKAVRDNIRNQNNPDDSTRPPVAEKDDYNFEKQRKLLEKRVAEYERRIKEKDYAPERKQLVLQDPRLKDMRRKLDDLQHNFRVEVRKEELKRRGLTGRVVDGLVEAASIPRTLLATGDLSAMFRQLMFVALSRPATFGRVFGKMHQFWWSEKAYEDYFADFKDGDAHLLAQKAGLALTDLSKNINAQAREEMFMSNSLSKIEEMVPILGKRTLPVKAFGKTFKLPGLGLHSRAERGFTGAINKMRIDLFNHGSELLMSQGKYPDTHPREFKQLATYLNAATGRGPMPERYSGVMKDLSAVFFAPRLATSRMYLLSGAPLFSNSVVRKMYARDLVTFLSFGMSTIWLASLMGAETDDDPTSVDFGMIRFGDKRYDPWGGFSQYARFAARMITGKVTSSTGRVRMLNSDEYGAMTYLDLGGRFIRGKLSPTASLLTSALDGKNFMGEPFSWRDELIGSLHPLIIQDIREAWVEMEEGPWSLLTTGVPAFYGVGVNAWRANAFLDRGVDDKLIELTNSKKVATLIPEEGRIRIIDLDDGEERKLTSSEYESYLNKWSDYIKKDLADNYDRYKAMSQERFKKEFDNIKSRATTYAKERISGVSTHDKTLSFGGKSYSLTPDQLRKRVDYNREFIADNEWRIYDRADRLQDNGMSREMALIEARKWINTKAREYSKQQIMEEFEGRLMEKE